MDESTIPIPYGCVWLSKGFLSVLLSRHHEEDWHWPANSRSLFFETQESVILVCLSMAEWGGMVTVCHWFGHRFVHCLHMQHTPWRLSGCCQSQIPCRLGSHPHIQFACFLLPLPGRSLAFLVGNEEEHEHKELFVQGSLNSLVMDFQNSFAARRHRRRCGLA